MSASAERGSADSRRAALLVIGITLLLIGVALSYLTLTRRWGYYVGPPLDPSQLIPEDRAALTV
jgi:hypothetical protein